jgi:aminoglycoside phosphotransferase (APT) family kinase protein
MNETGEASIPTADPPGINRASVSGWLTGVSRLRPPLTFTRIGHGQSNLTYLVADQVGRRIVMRRPPLGELAHGAHDMVREHRILTALADQPVPTARPLAISTDVEMMGAPTYLMDYVDGIVLHGEDSVRDLDLRAVGSESPRSSRSSVFTESTSMPWA